MDKHNEQKQEKRYERKPNIDTRAKLSRDGRYWIIERIETWILPRKYLDVIAQNHAAQLPGAESSNISPKPKRKGKRDVDSNG